MISKAEWPRRLLAFLLDTGFLSVFLGGLWYINVNSSRSFYFFLISALIALMYKPFTEYYYGATPGKMIVKIRVSNSEYRLIDFPSSLLRSCITFILPLGSIPLVYFGFENPELANLDNFSAFNHAMTNNYPQFRVLVILQLLVLVTDGIFLMVNKLRGYLSLKDIMAATRVVNA